MPEGSQGLKVKFTVPEEARFAHCRFLYKPADTDNHGYCDNRSCYANHLTHGWLLHFVQTAVVCLSEHMP
jgi:hypothetical protein